ncbi:Alpha/beta hydrolase family-domain-containing protein [Flammula alnicola]|nr:Alpha/beta hydrolase family-domain-containing protein [Flammula alnicola]
MDPNAYSRPPPFTWLSVDVRDALPIYPPPETLELPPLPSPPRKPTFDAPYTLTTHLIPACYLRTTRPAPEPHLPPPNASKEERRRILAEARQELDALRTSKVTDGYPRVLWNCVNRYVRKDLNAHNRTGLTLSFQHANGFPKEIFEPTLAHLLSSPAASIIDEVWAWESIQHGDACLVNAASASGIFDWYDNGRDIANFLLHFLPKVATNAPLPTHLVRVSPEETALRVKSGFSHRTFVAVGHSYGGCTSTLAASLYPNLFSSLYLIDPVIIKPHDHDKRLMRQDLAMGALNRRDTWSSREEALESFLKSPFFGAWDPASLNVYVECGIYTTADPISGKTVAKLKMPGVQEAVVFAELHTEYEVFQRLANLDERITLRWVTPGKPGASELGKPGSTRERVWVRPANATNTRISGGGHLMPQEAPQELAEDLKKFLLYNYSSLQPEPQSPVRASL